MRKISLIFFSLSIIIFVACGNIQSKPSINNIDYVIASQLQDLDNNYSDETLKAISVIIRNNVLIDGTQTINENLNEKYIEIVNSTKNQVLKTNKTDIIKLSFENTSDYTWQKIIKKSDILDFALKNNISLTNLSNIEEISNNGKITGIKIGNKSFDYELLAKQFNLESNQVTNISSTRNEIVVSGKGKGFFGYFDISISEQLSNNNYNYKEILKHFFGDLNLVNNNC